MFQPGLQSSEASCSYETATRLLVTGHASMEDLWALFSSFGEVSSIVLVEGGAKVTFLQDETLGRFYQSGEIAFGQQRVVVTKIKERKDQESLGTRFSLPPPPHLTLTNLEFLPPLPPFSPQYEASMLRSPQATPPPHHQPEIFTFNTSSFLEAQSAYPEPRQEHFLQPLTPISPGPLPPAPKLCRTNSFCFPPSSAAAPSLSESSPTIRIRRHTGSVFGTEGTLGGNLGVKSGEKSGTVFSSPYKKFIKFKVGGFENDRGDFY